MDFASDNIVGASPQILDAIVAANGGVEPSYGVDVWTKRAEARLREVFERDLDAFFVATGSAANMLALAAVTPPYGAVLCHAEAHVNTVESGGPELFTGGAKLVPLQGEGGRIAPAEVDSMLGPSGRMVYRAKPTTLSITNLTECGLAYRPDEVGALGEVAKRHGLRLHLDGARFANALVGTNASPAEMSWRAGVDILTFGCSKNGCLAAEAVIIFDKAIAADFGHIRGRTGHLLSKGRLLGAQMSAYLADDHWLDLARHANTMARRLADGLIATGGVRLAWPCEGNEVFAVVPHTVEARLQQAGASFYRWSAAYAPAATRPGEGEALIRLVCSFQTSADEVDRAIAAARSPI